MILHRRARVLTHSNQGGGPGPVVYWMSRDQRAFDNWALLCAQELALAGGKPLIVVFCLVPEFLGATIRQYKFMLQGLEKTAGILNQLNIPFYLLTGKVEEKIPEFIFKHNVHKLVTDFDPLRIKRQWKEAVAAKIDILFYEVDTHNVVPCWLASPKQEYAAYTFRPKIKRLAQEFLCDFPELQKHPFQWHEKTCALDWDNILNTLHVDRTVAEIDRIKPGQDEGQKALQAFLEQRFNRYSASRNDPTIDGQSGLSPYLHFGQLSAQRVLLAVERHNGEQQSKAAFIEELLVRRELSDNFCFYNEQYDSLDCFPDWAKKTLNAHRKDRRQYIYASDEFENAKTHDPLWNAAQLQMVHQGRMHGYMRMYWAKKILEWTPSPEEALETAIYLNDKYELDGRDPNGYTGIAWSIGGVHDRAWKERPVFGKIRYMSYRGSQSKFNVKDYIDAQTG